MMASHRPSDPPPEPMKEPTGDQPIGPKGAPKLPTLEPSAFLAGFDHLLAIGVLVLGFLLASFAIKNSDYFMHLAAGRLLAEGEYSFGKDPFSYVDAERTWINHAWLFDLGLYQLQKAAGHPGVVMAKAILVAMLAGFLLITRKPGQPFWPAVVCVGLGLVAAAPRLLMQPVLASYFCFALLLLLLMRMPRSATSWRFPIVVGVLFWFWANLDQWFFLGPLTLLLYTAGQYLHRDEGEQPTVLWKAFVIGVVACMLNPHHIRVWTLPPELVDSELAKVVADDVEYSPVFQDAFGKGAVDFGIGAERDHPANVYSLTFLVVLGLVSFALNYRRLSVGLLLVWVGSVLLYLFHLRAVPFVGLAGAAIAAANLAAFGQQYVGRTYNDGTVRVLHMLRTFGRGGTAIIGLFLIALTYAGWLHPLAQQRRWKWDVEPNTSMVNAATKLQEWRTAGMLPPEAKLLNLQPDFANYVAWYAPGEKTYCDFRFAFHKPEFESYVELRKFLGPGMDPIKQAKLGFDFPAFLRKNGIVYAVTAHPGRGRNMSAFIGLWANTMNEKGEPEWSIWHLDGRAIIFGWERQTVVASEKLQGLRFDPVKAAYTNVAPLKKVEEPRPPITERDIWDRYVMSPPPAPSAGEEVLILQEYRKRLSDRVVRTVVREVEPQLYKTWSTFQLTNLFMGPYVGQRPMIDTILRQRPERLLEIHMNKLLENRVPPEINALNILAIRAARRAVLESPNHPDGYYFLSEAYQAGGVLDISGIAPPVSTSSLARHLARIPSDPAQRRSTVPVFLSASRLQRDHSVAQPPRLDMALNATRMSAFYLEYELEPRRKEYDRASKAEQQETDNLERDLKQMLKGIQVGDEEIQKLRDQFINEAARTAVAVERASIARRYGLAQEALDELLKEVERIGKSNQSDTAKTGTLKERAEQIATYAELAELLLYAGRAEDANDLLESFDNPQIMEELQSERLRQAYANVRQSILQRLRMQFTEADTNPAGRFRYLKHLVAMAMGDYAKAQNLLASSLDFAKQNFSTYRQTILTKFAPKAAKEYTPEKLHEHMTILAKCLPVVQTEALPLLTQSSTEVPFLYFVISNNVAGGYFSSLRDLLDNHIRLGLVYLEEGDIAAAKFHFKEADQLPPLLEVPSSLKLARAYLKAIP